MTRSFLPVLAVLSLCGCFNLVDGGPELSETRSLDGFTRVRVEGGLPVTVRPGPPSVVITAPQKVVENLQTVVKSGQLTVRLKPGVTATSFASTEIIVTTPSLTSVEASGGSHLTASGVEASPFRATASGGSEVRLSGSTADARLNASGGSRVDASALSAAIASVDASGGSTIEVNVSQTLEGTASGGSRVLVSGSGDVSAVSTSGGGSVSNAQ